MSQTLTVVSALADARTFLNSRFHDNPMTASSCEPPFNAFDSFLPPFLPFLLAALIASSEYPPSVVTGSTASTQSKSQISIPGYIVPIAAQLTSFVPLLGAQFIHATLNGNAGKSTS